LTVNSQYFLDFWDQLRPTGDSFVRVCDTCRFDKAFPRFSAIKGTPSQRHCRSVQFRHALSSGTFMDGTALVDLVAG
jgi:hypothetical protein